MCVNHLHYLTLSMVCKMNNEIPMFEYREKKIDVEQVNR